jgi:hypothetical protein
MRVHRSVKIEFLRVFTPGLDSQKMDKFYIFSNDVQNLSL